MDWLVRLQQVMEAKNKGLIDEEEYRSKRAALIAGMEAAVTGTAQQDQESDSESESESSVESDAQPFDVPTLQVDDAPVQYHAALLSALPEGALFKGRYRIELKLRHSEKFAVYRVLDIKDQLPYELHIYKSLNDEDRLRVEKEHAIGFRSTHAQLPKASFADLDAEPPYRVTAFVPGISLRDKLSIRAGNVSYSEALGIMWSLIDGIEYMHRAQIPHLDLRPETIYLTRQGDLCLRDFGLESRFQPLQTGHFLSPEQRRDGSGDLRSDVYALGMVFLRLVKGALPVEPQDEARFNTWLDATPNIDVPDAVLAVIRQSLRSDPQARFDSVIDLKKALQGATYKRGWTVLPSVVVEEVSQRSKSDRLWLTGTSVSVQDALSLLEQGSAWPSYQTLDGQILLEGDICAMAIVDVPIPSDNDSLTSAYRDALNNSVPFDDWVLSQEDTSSSFLCRSAKAAMALGLDDFSLSLMDKILPKYSSDWLAVSETWRSCFDNIQEAALSLDRAAQSAASTLEHIQIATYIRWLEGDLRRAELVMGRAFEAAVHFEDWLNLAQAYLALLNDEQQAKVSIGRAMNLLEDESVMIQADKAALSGERLGASPAVIRWGISLEQKAQTSREILAVETMWRQMNLVDRAIPLAERRQTRLNQELIRLRSLLVPLEIQLPLPVSPFDEYSVESYAAQVAEQQKLHAESLRIASESAAYLPNHPNLKKPYIQSDIAERQRWLDKQLKYANQVESLYDRAALIGWTCPKLSCPRNAEQLQQAEAAISFQEDLHQEFQRLWPHIDFIALPDHPRTVADLDSIRAQLNAEPLLSQMAEIVVEAAEVYWQPPKQILPLSIEKIDHLSHLLGERRLVFEAWVHLRDRALAIDWELNAPVEALTDDFLLQTTGRVELQERLVVSLNELNDISQEIGLESIERQFPLIEEDLATQREFILLQKKYFEQLLNAKAQVDGLLGWAPPLPSMPIDDSDVSEYQALIDKQVAHGSKLLSVYEKWPKSAIKRFPLPEPPYTQLIVRAHIKVVGEQLKRLKQKQMILALMVVAIIAILLSIWLLGERKAHAHLTLERSEISNLSPGHNDP